MNNSKTVLPSMYKNVPPLFFNSSVKHWPILTIFGMRH